MVDEPVRGGFPDPSFFSFSGIEQARRAVRGLVPPAPLHYLVGIRVTQIGAGTATGTLPVSPWFQEVAATVDFRILIDGTAYYAALTGAPPATAVHTSVLAINNMRPCTLDSGTLVARAHTLNSGPTFTLVDVLVEDAEGRGVAHGTATSVLRPIDPPPPPPTDAGGPYSPPIYATPHPWQRPVLWSPADARLDDLPIIDVFRGIDSGALPLPPLEELLGIRFVDIDEGAVTLTMTASEWFADHRRHVQPGVLSSLAWHASGGAMATLAPAGIRVSVLDQTATFLNLVPTDGRELLARGAVSHCRGELVLSTAEITDADGNTVAVAHQTSLLTSRHRRRPAGGPQRVLATVLFSDIVGSTERAERLGDARWSELLEEHHRVVRKQLELFKGREVKTTGDGFLATFDSPGQAVQCARAIRDGVRRLGLQVRVGVHSGECEISGADVAGIAVHIASRFQGLAEPGEILVSATVRDLVTGSALRFVDRGHHRLKGIEGDWSVFALEG